MEERKKQDISEREFNSRVSDVTYSRHHCRRLNIDYSDIREKDIEKIRDYLKETYIIRR